MSQILDVSYGIKLDSPLSPLEVCPPKQCQFRDVKVEDILNAPSLSVSLQTATDASAFLDENSSNFK